MHKIGIRPELGHYNSVNDASVSLAECLIEITVVLPTDYLGKRKTNLSSHILLSFTEAKR